MDHRVRCPKKDKESMEETIKLYNPQRETVLLKQQNTQKNAKKTIEYNKKTTFID